MTDKLVCSGSDSLLGDGTVSYSFLLTVTLEHVGFKGMAERLWFRYQAKILWPNLEVLEDAPATANVGELKKVLAAACMSGEDVIVLLLQCMLSLERCAAGGQLWNQSVCQGADLGMQSCQILIGKWRYCGRGSVNLSCNCPALELSVSNMTQQRGSVKSSILCIERPL